MKKKPWSISTTVRNPARLRDFLLVLADLEGKPFDEKTQREFQVRLICRRLYLPTKVPEEYREIFFENPEAEIPYDIAQRVFDAQDYKDPSMRGRQSANPLNKLGLAIASQRRGKVQITQAGRLLIEQPEKASDLLFLSLLKLQYPNPISRDFREEQGFSIVPLIGCLFVFHHLAERGIHSLDKTEFCLFIPTLINASQIKNQVRTIAEFRQLPSERRKDRAVQWVRTFYSNHNLTEQSTEFKNLYEYGDNAMRYFRFTRYLQVVSDPLKGDWQMAIEPLRQAEIEMLLNNFSCAPKQFSSAWEYIEYLGNPDQPNLPWKQRDRLREVAKSLREELGKVTAERLQPSELMEADINMLDQKSLELLIEQMRSEIYRLTQEAHREKLRLSISHLEKYTQEVNIFSRKRGLQPEELEHLLFNILLVIDDEERISPNYPTDDHGNPISHAPGGKADIECFYSTFAMTVEVTLDSGRLQWVREGQPVMRHLREFENRVSPKPAFCLFVAPRIHQDTYSQFWIAVRYEYGGKRQRILPLSCEQLSKVLGVYQKMLKSNKSSHELLRRLVEMATEVDDLCGYTEWRGHIEKAIVKWAEEALNGTGYSISG